MSKNDLGIFKFKRSLDTIGELSKIIRIYIENFRFSFTSELLVLNFVASESGGKKRLKSKFCVNSVAP